MLRRTTLLILLATLCAQGRRYGSPPVHKPPEQIITGKHIYVAGETLFLTCTVSPPPTYIHWSRNNMDVVSKAIDSTEAVWEQNMVRSNLTIKNVSGGDSGDYRCITDGDPTGFSVLVVTIQASPSKMTLTGGSPARLFCSANGNKLELDWFKDGSRLNDSNTYTVVREPNNTVLLIKNVTLSIAGTYSCALSGRGKPLVNISISVISETDVILKKFGEDAKLDCTSAASQETTWEKDGKDIDLSNTEKYSSTNTTLTVKNVSLEDVGDYICKFGDSSMKIGLQVKAHVVSSSKASRNLIEGDSYSMECSWDGSRDNLIGMWMKNNTELEASDHIVLEGGNGTNTIKLTIKNARREEEAGNYTCFAENDYGNDSYVIKIRVKDKLAALWPFLGICAEVAILCLIIFIYEKKRSKDEEDDDGAAENMKNANDHKDQDLRHRNPKS